MFLRQCPALALFHAHTKLLLVAVLQATKSLAGSSLGTRPALELILNPDLVL